ncbi:alpha/beta fold hydrolase [Brevibacillus borstelensis]|uniref:alpha/beta fold hydrolase n=1 Tax=Brevibacillus borstelensis TaxID=45462 RepID=UPI00148F99CB|nr:alpha/beta hydrolase [Brevibacillus borstelensis]NOU57731.1 alpha/beta hydrolase [Brevibacillus borstelensis]
MSENTIVPTANSSRLAVQLYGSGQPLVCIHAPGIGMINFSRLHGLAEHFQLILPDLPGHGASEPLFVPFTMADLSETLEEMIHALGHKRVVVMGYSQGASLALDWCLRHPDSIAGLVLISGFSEVNELYLHSRFYLAEAIAKLGGVSLLARSTASSHLDKQADKEQWIKHASRTDAKTLHHLYRIGHHYRCTERLHEIKQPVLLVYGQQDKHMHPYGELLEKHLPKAKLVAVPGVKHQIVTRAASSLSRLCREFIGSLPGSSV